MKRLGAESRAAWTERTPLSVAMVMIDGYEDILAARGREVVDRIIFEVARLLEGDLRTRDFVGRCRDDTFGAILPETTAATANALAVRLRLTIASSCFGGLDDPVDLTVSVGVANRAAESEKTPAELTDEARDKCHEANREGGNRVRGASINPGVRVGTAELSDPFEEGRY